MQIVGLVVVGLTVGPVDLLYWVSVFLVFSFMWVCMGVCIFVCRSKLSAASVYTPCPGKKEASSFSTISRAVLDRFS